MDARIATGRGVITRSDLLALGMPPVAIGRMTATDGPWQRLLPGTYLAHRGTATETERARAALAYAGARAVLSGPVALRMRGFRAGTTDPRVHVLVPHALRCQSTGFVVTERTRRPPVPTMVRGLPVAPVARAVVDAGRWSEDGRATLAMVAEAVQREKCSPAELLAELTAATRRRTAALRAAMGPVVAGARSVAEADGRDLVLRARLPEPAWNVDLSAPDGTFLARPDGWWDDLGVAWQIDSREFHLAPADWERTLRAHAALTSYGVLVVHTLPSQLTREPAAVASDLRRTLAAAATRPAPRLAVGHPHGTAA